MRTRPSRRGGPRGTRFRRVTESEPDSATEPIPAIDPDGGSAGAPPGVLAGVLEDEPATHSSRDEPAPAVPLTACTVATAATLPSVRVLARSFADHHPGARFHTLVVDCAPDDVARLASPAPGVDFLHPAALGLTGDELAELRTACSPDELRAALRPRLVHHLVTSTETSGPVLYLDPSVLVLAPVTGAVLGGLVEHSLVLLPRVLRPLPEDGLRPDTSELRAAGLFDPSFVAVNRGAADFLLAWAEHELREPGGAGAFLDGSAVLLDHHVLRDPGIGLSVWNAGQRGLVADERGAVTVTGEPLRTVHFDGFDPARPWLLSAAVATRPRVLLSEHRLLAKLCTAYVTALAAASAPGDPAGERQRIGSSPLPDGLRARYRTALLAAARTGTPRPPALATSPVGFLEWACAPDDGPGSTRWAAAVWEADQALRRRFPDPFGADADGFREWCAGTGVSGGALPPEAVPAGRDADPRLTDQLGVSVLGGGKVAALLRAAATASGLPVSNDPDYPVVLCCEGVPPGLSAHRYVIAAPDDSGAVTDRRGAHEVWTLSETSRAALDGAIGVPVHAVPLPVRVVDEREPGERDAARSRLDWPDKPDSVVFAAVADHAHERADNALGAVGAFTAAFDGRSDVRLLLVVTGAADRPEAAERLRLATAEDDRIELVEDPPDPAGWLDTADCVLALHRVDRIDADRVGLAVADAVVRGLPVVALDGGATGELLARDGALLVRAGADGAEPDRAMLSEALRAVAEDPVAVAELGRVGREELLLGHDIAVAGARLRDRVELAYHAWRARHAAARVPADSDPLRPLRSARHVLHREPDVAANYKIPMAPALRKAVLRVLAHYDAHQRAMLGTLVDGMERSVEELAARQAAAGTGSSSAEVDLLAERLDRVSERLAAVDDRMIGVDDAALRARSDLAGQSRRLGELEDAVVGEAAKRATHLGAVTDRLDLLTDALSRILDRMDGLEARVADAVQAAETRTETGLRAASQALRASDALRRVVVREHERADADRSAGSDSAEPEEPRPSGSLVLSDAGLLRLPADDGVMLPLLSSNGVWEQELSTLIDSLVEPGGVFVDVGAYVGYHTIRVLSRLGTSGAVVAVEPDGTAAKLLRHNVSINVPDAVAERLTFLEAAAWDTAGELAAEPAMTGGLLVRPVSTTPDGMAADQEPTAPAAPTVPAVRLDREFERIESLKGMPLSVVKIDIPGRGHRALAGLVRLLRRDRPHVFLAFSAALTEEIGDDPVTVLREFDTWGFDVLRLGDAEPSGPQAIVDAAADLHSVTLWLRPRGRAA